MSVTIALDLGSRVRQAYSQYVDAHQGIFDRAVMGLSFKGPHYARATETLSQVRSELDLAMRTMNARRGEAIDPLESSYLSHLHGYADALDDSAARLLSLCRLFTEQEPSPADIAGYRSLVERHVARERDLHTAETRLIEHVQRASGAARSNWR